MNNIDILLIAAAVLCFVLDAFSAKIPVKLDSLGFALLTATLLV